MAEHCLLLIYYSSSYASFLQVPTVCFNVQYGSRTMFRKGNNEDYEKLPQVSLSQSIDDHYVSPL